MYILTVEILTALLLVTFFMLPCLKSLERQVKYNYASMFFNIEARCMTKARKLGVCTPVPYAVDPLLDT